MHTAAHSRATACSNSIAHAFTRFEFPLLLVSSFQFPHHRPTHCNPLCHPHQHNPSLTLQPPLPPPPPAFPHHSTLSSTLLSLRRHRSRSFDSPTCGEQHRVLVYELVSSSTGKDRKREDRRERRRQRGRRRARMREKGARRGGAVVGRERRSGAQDMQTRCVLENLPLPFRISFLRAASVRAYSPRRFTGEERRPAAYLVEYLTTLDSRGRCTYRVVTLRSRQHRGAVHARVRARVRARSVLSKSLGAFLDSASLGLTRPWRGLSRLPLLRSFATVPKAYCAGNML